MVDIRDLHQSNRIKCSDLKGQDVTLKIRDYEIVEMGEGETEFQKLELGFHGQKKRFLLNITNQTTIAMMYGLDSDDWIDKDITVYPSETEFAGKMVDCIRIRRETPSIREDVAL